MKHILLAIAVLGTAYLAATTLPGTSGKERIIAGYVVDGTTGVRMPGVNVELWCETNKVERYITERLSDAKGEFGFALPYACDMYVLKAEVPNADYECGGNCVRLVPDTGAYEYGPVVFSLWRAGAPTLTPTRPASPTPSVTTTWTLLPTSTRLPTFTATPTRVQVRVYGAIREEGSGEPLANVTIELESGAWYRAVRTDAQGSFEILLDPPASQTAYELWAHGTATHSPIGNGLIARIVVGAAREYGPYTAAMRPRAGPTNTPVLTAIPTTTGAPRPTEVIWPTYTPEPTLPPGALTPLYVEFVGPDGQLRCMKIEHDPHNPLMMLNPYFVACTRDTA